MTDHPSDAPRPRWHGDLTDLTREDLEWCYRRYWWLIQHSDEAAWGLERMRENYAILEADLGKAREENERLAGLLEVEREAARIARHKAEYQFEAARVAEGKAEVYRERVHFLQHQHSSNIGPSCHMCLAMLDALTPAADVAEGGKG